MAEIHLTVKDQRFLERLGQTDTLHWFGRGYCPALTIVETNPIAKILPSNKAGLEPRRLTKEETQLFQDRAWITRLLTEEEMRIIECTKFSPTTASLDGDEFLALIVQAKLITNGQVKKLFERPPRNFDAITWAGRHWSQWPDIKSKGKGLANLAQLLGKKGVQRYAWDGGHGDVSESWRTVFIQADGELFWENTQAYGGMFA